MIETIPYRRYSDPAQLRREQERIFARAYDDRIGREDRAMTESVHRGMRSGLLDHGALLAGSERLIAGFQAWLRGQLDA